MLAYVHSQEEWKCLFGEYRIPFVQTPYLMARATPRHFRCPPRHRATIEASPPQGGGGALAVSVCCTSHTRARGGRLHLACLHVRPNTHILCRFLCRLVWGA